MKKWTFVILALAVVVIKSMALPRPAQAALTVGISDWPGWVAWYVAEQKGYFKKYGADVKLIWFPSYIDSVQALSAGKLDANSQALIDTLAPLAKGVPLKVVLVTDNSAGNDALMAKNSIHSFAELKGKTVAFEQYSIENYLAFACMAKHGLKPRDVNVVSMTTGNAASALMAGRTDAAGVWNPWINRIENAHKGHPLCTSKSEPGLIPDLLVVRQPVLAHHRKDLVAMTRAWFSAVRYIKAHPMKAAAIMAPHVDLKPKEYALSLKGTRFFGPMLNRKAMTKSGAPESLYKSTRDTADFLEQGGELKHMPKPADFVDASIVKAAIKADGGGQ